LLLPVAKSVVADCAAIDRGCLLLMIQGAEAIAAAAAVWRQPRQGQKREARAVRQQMEQIQDEVSRQALLSRSREIEANLARGELQVVVFGTGSAGSLVNALIGHGRSSRCTDGNNRWGDL